jgi:hypothetical protein
VKQLYVRGAHRLRDHLARTGRMRFLDDWARRSRAGAWARSLLAIHDVRALVELDTPWWTFESADLVAAHLAARPRSTVFEWGSGASTAWLANRATSVVAVEHVASWADQVRGLVGTNALVVTVPPAALTGDGGVRSAKVGHGGLDFSDYVRAIDDHPGTFDLIVIDGRAREACLRSALPRLAADGLIVFDNVDRVRYRDAIAREPDIEVLTTRGLTPALPYPTQTALIRKRPPR